MTMSETENPAAPKVLGGRYEIHRKIARGGMAEVYLARDRSLDRPVAVKMLFPEFATDPAFVERFRREAQAAANLAHPNIVGVYDWGTENGTYYIVMEYVDGESVADICRTSGPMRPRRAAEIADEVAAALGFAHSKGVVHRDIKPGNILISTSGSAKVVDFGIARALSSPSEELTQAGSVMGTATYFSPEQAQGFQVDSRSDLYSLGVVLFEMVCGRPPFTGDSPVSIAYKHVQEPPPRPSKLISGLPAGLEAIIGKLLSKHPDNRYLSAEDLRSDLRRFLENLDPIALTEQAPPAPVVDPNATVAVAPITSNATTVLPIAPTPVPPAAEYADDYDDEWDDEEEARPQRTGLFVGLLLVLLLIAAGLVFFLVKNLNKDATTTDEVAVPQTIGLSQADAEKLVRDRGFNPVSQEKPDETVQKGYVSLQSPTAETTLAKGKDVLLTISSGPANVPIPSNLAGLSKEAASQLLIDAGFQVNVVEEQSDTVDAGRVIGTTPAAGVSTPTGTSVDLRVSTGKAPTAIPDVANKSQDQARKALQNAGFVVGDIKIQGSPDVKKGNVIGTDPTGTAPKGSSINLLVSGGPDQINVPTVTGQTEANATNAISAKGFDVSVKTSTVPPGDPSVGRVISQTPDGGTPADPGSAVTITVGVAGATTTSNSPTTSSATTTTSP